MLWIVQRGELFSETLNEREESSVVKSESREGGCRFTWKFDIKESEVVWDVWRNRFVLSGIVKAILKVKDFNGLVPWSEKWKECKSNNRERQKNLNEDQDSDALSLFGFSLKLLK